MRLVFVVDAYYPRYAAVEKCAKNLIDVLARDGHEVTVVAKRYWDSPADHTGELAEDTVYVSTRLSRVRSRVDGRIAATSGALGWRLADRACAVVNYAGTLLGRSCVHRALVDAYLGAIEGLGFVPDQLVPCSSPFEGVVACAEYARRHPGVRLTPVIFDQFADSGTLCKTSFTRELKRKANLAVERDALEASDVVLNVTWEEHVRQYHPGCLQKLVHIEHPLLVRPAGLPDNGARDGDGRSRVIFAGSLSAGVRDPSAALDIFRGLGEVAHLDMFVMGSGRELVQEAADADPGAVSLNDPVPSSEMAALLAAGDCLLSIGNTTSDQKPSKVVEYMALGKPILHICAIEDDPVRADVGAYPLGCVIEAGEDLARAREAVRAFLLETRGKEMAFDEVAELFRDEDPEVAVERLLSCGGGSLIIAGTFSKMVPPAYLIELLRATRGAVRADVYTAPAWARRLGDDPVFAASGSRALNWVPADELPALYEAHDCLLSIGELPGRQQSSKIFGYMATGKPVVHIYHAEGDANLPYLEGYPLALTLRDDEASLEENAGRLCRFLLWARGRKLGFHDVCATMRDCTPEAVCDALLRKTPAARGRNLPDIIRS